MPSEQNSSVLLAAGTHTWVPTQASEAFQDELLDIMRAHRITKLDTAKLYVCLAP
jgi:hypothetical protein